MLQKLNDDETRFEDEVDEVIRLGTDVQRKDRPMKLKLGFRLKKTLRVSAFTLMKMENYKTAFMKKIG